MGKSKKSTVPLRARKSKARAVPAKSKTVHHFVANDLTVGSPSIGQPALKKNK
jgi:hypothetical protein